MKPSTFLRILCAVLFLIMIGWSPQSVFAQHGGHGGGGGFHGGGGGFHGGGGGWHGGNGWHGGGGGWHGGSGWYGGGYSGWGYGWGVNIGFNWGPFWGGGYGYPYGFGWAAPYYSPYYAYPYPYPYYVQAEAPPGYAPSNSSYDPGSSGYSYSSRPTGNSYADNPATQSSSATASDSAVNVNYVALRETSYTRPAHSPITHAAVTPSSYRPANSATRQLPPLRPAVQNVIRALRAMPPDARQRQIDSGRYNNLSPKELELAKYASGLPSHREQAEEEPLRAN